jgi:hypothetical protein
MVYGLGFMVRSLWLRDVGFWCNGSEFRFGFMVHGSWFMVYGLWFMVYGLWFSV